MEKVVFKNIDEYIKSYPENIQIILQKVRTSIKEAAPNAIEKISWQMPTFVLNGNLVHFAMHKNHVGFYPGESGISHFIDEISQYKFGKGSVQFPISNPMPYDLIKRIVEFRVKENMQKSRNKKRANSSFII